MKRVIRVIRVDGEQCPLMCDVAIGWRVGRRVFSLEDVIWVTVGVVMWARVC